MCATSAASSYARWGSFYCAIPSLIWINHSFIMPLYISGDYMNLEVDGAGHHIALSAYILQLSGPGIHVIMLCLLSHFAINILQKSKNDCFIIEWKHPAGDHVVWWSYPGYWRLIELMRTYLIKLFKNKYLSWNFHLFIYYFRKICNIKTSSRSVYCIVRLRQFPVCKE